MVGHHRPSNGDNLNGDGGGRDVRMRACMRACVHDVFAVYDNNILPRLIMIIIQMIIRYFIQITHADDFLSKGTRLVMITCRK